MSFNIDTKRDRAALAPRREPYWGAPLAPGRFLGFRKIDAERGSWIARARDKDAGAESKQQYRALGELTDTLDYHAACKAAREWFASLDAGVTTKERVTVEDACREYVENRRRKKGDACAYDAEWRFTRSVYETPFARTELTKLRAPAIEKWRESLGMTKAGENRMMTSLRAALNLAVRNRQVAATAAQEWREVKQHPKADGRRRLYLDLKQRRALLKGAKAVKEPDALAVRDLIEAAAVTGARPGELAKAAVEQFDARTKTMRFIGKTGSRDVPLSPAGVRLFTRLAKGKPPDARLFVRDEGQPWGKAEWTELVRAAAKAAELPADPDTGVCLYTLRHSFITATLLGGMPTLEVARLTGTSLQMIEENYGHLVATAARARLAKVRML